MNSLDDLKIAVNKKVAECVNIAREELGITLPFIYIHYNVRG